MKHLTAVDGIRCCHLPCMLSRIFAVSIQLFSCIYAYVCIAFLACRAGESPTGHLPILYLDGEPLIETFAILRRLAKRFGSYGRDEDRDYQIDMVVDATINFR